MFHSGMVARIADGKRCDNGLWLWEYPSTAQGCLDLVTVDSRCDNTYFSWADASDHNCWCVTPGTDCQSSLVDHSFVSTWRSRLLGIVLFILSLFRCPSLFLPFCPFPAVSACLSLSVGVCLSVSVSTPQRHMKRCVVSCTPFANAMAVWLLFLCIWICTPFHR